jgi:hypothetical protein
MQKCTPRIHGPMIGARPSTFHLHFPHWEAHMSWLCATSKCMSSYSTQWVVPPFQVPRPQRRPLNSSGSSTPRRFHVLTPSSSCRAVYVAPFDEAGEVSMQLGTREPMIMPPPRFTCLHGGFCQLAPIPTTGACMRRHNISGDGRPERLQAWS